MSTEDQRAVRILLTAEDNRHVVALAEQEGITIGAAQMRQQREDYSLDTCVVGGAALGSTGDPVELVAGTTLVRLCCDSCLPKFRANPAEFLGKLPRE